MYLNFKVENLSKENYLRDSAENVHAIVLRKNIN